MRPLSPQLPSKRPQDYEAHTPSQSSRPSDAPNPLRCHLLRLPAELRIEIYKLALACDFIQYNTYNSSVPPHMRNRNTKPRLEFCSNGKILKGVRGLSNVRSLAVVNRQLRSETACLVWQINVFNVSA
jgi:hypothetical protein